MSTTTLQKFWSTPVLLYSFPLERCWLKANFNLSL